MRAALLAELNGGEDAALVVQMVERVRPVVSPPTQVVAPVPHPTGEEDPTPEAQVRPVDATPEAQVRPVDPPTQAVATPQADQIAPPDGNTAATAVEISDSEDELLVIPASRRSGSSD